MIDMLPVDIFHYRLLPFSEKCDLLVSAL